MILYKVLRLYPHNQFFNRTLQKDMELRNLSLPTGVKVTLPIILHHQDADIWGNDALEFKPEMFSKGVSKATKRPSCVLPIWMGS